MIYECFVYPLLFLQALSNLNEIVFRDGASNQMILPPKNRLFRQPQKCCKYEVESMHLWDRIYLARSLVATFSVKKLASAIILTMKRTSTWQAGGKSERATRYVGSLPD